MIRRPPRSTLFPYTTPSDLGRTWPAREQRHLAEDRAGLKLGQDRKSTRLNSSHQIISYAVFCLEKKDDVIKEIYVESGHPVFVRSNLITERRGEYLVARRVISLVFFNDTATTEIYTLSLHDALPISLEDNSRAILGRLDDRAAEETL